VDNPRDKNGRQIMPGDTLKVFHYVGSRRKKYYMYKYVVTEYEDSLLLSHLTPKEEYYHLTKNGEVLQTYEVVQGYGDKGIHFEDREKVL
jgi:hypothetical protein